MVSQKLNYRFHNPNTVETTADYILEVFMEVNGRKVERVIQKMKVKDLEKDPCDENGEI